MCPKVCNELLYASAKELQRACEELTGITTKCEY